MTDKRCILCKFWQGDMESVKALCDKPEFVRLVRLDDGTFKSEKPIHETYRDSWCGNFEREIPKEFLDAFAAAIREEIASLN